MQLINEALSEESYGQPSRRCLRKRCTKTQRVTISHDKEDAYALSEPPGVVLNCDLTHGRASDNFQQQKAKKHPSPSRDPSTGFVITLGMPATCPDARALQRSFDAITDETAESARTRAARRRRWDGGYGVFRRGRHKADKWSATWSEREGAITSVAKCARLSRPSRAIITQRRR